MTTALRKTGIDVVGDMPWGTHFCHFYDTKEDLLDTLVPYYKAGLEANELCIWVLSEPLTEDEAWTAMRRAVPDLDRHLDNRSIELFLARDWYLRGGRFELQRIIDAWNAKLEGALARGYDGLRVSGNTAWLDRKDWHDLCEYEAQLNGGIGDQLMTVFCTYPLTTSGASELLDVARTHQFATAKRQGAWEVLETPQLRQAKAEIARLNAELDGRVVEWTRQLEVTRVVTLGELTSSLAHELNQPLSAIVANGEACLRWLGRGEPDVAEAVNAVARIIRDANRATDVITHTRALLRKSMEERVLLDLAELIREVLGFVRPEIHRHGIAVREFLAEDLPLLEGDRAQLQQVLLNLVMNAIEAMAAVRDRPRDLVISTRRAALDDRPASLVAVQDAGVGVAPENLGRLFEAFYTTKPDGVGMGLSIGRSLVEAHGGRLWAVANPAHGATFQFLLPARREY